MHAFERLKNPVLMVVNYIYKCFWQSSARDEVMLSEIQTQNLPSKTNLLYFVFCIFCVKLALGFIPYSSRILENTEC